MKLHHQKHHQTYVNALNDAEEKYAKASDVKEQIQLQAALKFNGGGMFRKFVLKRVLIHLFFARAYQPFSFLEEPCSCGLYQPAIW
jgi:superoxide dismutase